MIVSSPACHYQCNIHQSTTKKEPQVPGQASNPIIVCRTPQELLLTRLAMGIVEREDDDVTMEKLDKALGELFEKKVMLGLPGDGWGSVLLYR